MKYDDGVYMPVRCLHLGERLLISADFDKSCKGGKLTRPLARCSSPTTCKSHCALQQRLSFQTCHASQENQDTTFAQETNPVSHNYDEGNFGFFVSRRSGATADLLVMIALSSHLLYF